MSSRAEAEDALYGAIISAAENASEQKDATLLKETAEAFREVAHGPNGGSYEMERHAFDQSQSTSDSNYEGRTTYDYHETRHAGEDRERPETGFRG